MGDHNALVVLFGVQETNCFSSKISRVNTESNFLFRPGFVCEEIWTEYEDAFSALAQPLFYFVAQIILNS